MYGIKWHLVVRLQIETRGILPLINLPPLWSLTMWKSFFRATSLNCQFWDTVETCLCAKYKEAAIYSVIWFLNGETWTKPEPSNQFLSTTNQRGYSGHDFISIKREYLWVFEVRKYAISIYIFCPSIDKIIIGLIKEHNDPDSRHWRHFLVAA